MQPFATSFRLINIRKLPCVFSAQLIMIAVDIPIRLKAAAIFVIVIIMRKLPSVAGEK